MLDLARGVSTFELASRTHGSLVPAARRAAGGLLFAMLGLTVIPDAWGQAFSTDVNNLQTMADGRSVILTWDQPGQPNYNRFWVDWHRDANPVGENGSEWVVQETTVTVAGLRANESYSFRVRACFNTSTGPSNSGCIGSGAWTQYQAQVTGVDPPSAPVLSYTEPTAGNSDSLQWDAPSDDGGEAVTDYEYRRRPHTDPETAWEAWTSTMATSRSFSVTKPNEHSAYEYQVRAINSGGDGAESNTVVIAGRPTGLGTLMSMADDNMASVTVTWSAPANDGGKPITQYVVQWRPDSDNDWNTDGPSGQKTVASGTSVTFTATDGLHGGTTYNFRYRAHNTDRQSFHTPVDGEVQATTPITPPSAPAITGVTVLAKLVGGGLSDRIRLWWNGPAGNGGRALSCYQLEHDDHSDFRTADVYFMPASTTSPAEREIQAFAANTRYFRLRATNDTGVNCAVGQPSAQNADYGPWSATHTLPAPPGAPTELDAAAGSSGDQIALSWTAPSGGETPTGYKWEHAEAPASPSSTWTSGGTLAGTGTSATVTLSGVANAHTAFRVRATNAGGEGPPSASDDVAGRPGSIASLTSEVDQPEKVSLSWTAGATGGKDITYRIQRRPTSSQQDSHWRNDATTAATSWTRPDVSERSAISYRVRAENDDRVGSWTVIHVSGRPVFRGDLAEHPVAKPVMGLGDRMILTWKVPKNTPEGGDNDTYGNLRPEGPVTSFLYQWREVGAGAWSGATEARGGRADRSPVTVTVGGLSAGTTYEFRVRADTATRLGKFSNTATAATAATAAITATNPRTLTEARLHGATLTVELDGTEYRPVPVPTSAFTLKPALPGLRVSTVLRQTDTRAVLTLAFNGDLTENTNLSVRIGASAHVGSENLTAGPVGVTAAADGPAWTLTLLSQNAQITQVAETNADQTFNLQARLTRGSGTEDLPANTTLTYGASSSATRPTDFDGTLPTLARQADGNSAIGNIALVIKGDEHDEPDETIVFSAAVGDRMFTTTLTITDDDPPMAAVPGKPGVSVTRVQGGGTLFLNITAPNDGGAAITGYECQARAVSQTDFGGVLGTVCRQGGGSFSPNVFSGDEDSILRVRASNSVGSGPWAYTRVYRSGSRDTTAPSFTEGASTTRSVAEDAPVGSSVGNPVTATDPEVGSAGDELTYSLLGADAAVFDIEGDSGQISTRFAFDRRVKIDYDVTVRVEDLFGNSATIAVAIMVTAPTTVGPLPRLPPPALTVTPGDERLDLSWPPVSGATGYRIRYRCGSTSEYQDPPNQPIDDGAAKAFEITGLTNGDECAVGISARAHNNPDFRGSGWAADVLATPVAPLGAPSNLEAGLFSGEIFLRWQTVPGAGGYVIFWKGDGEAYSAENSHLTPLSTSSVGTASWTPGSSNVTLDVNLGWTFKVRAVRDAAQANTDPARTPQDSPDETHAARTPGVTVSVTELEVNEGTGEGSTKTYTITLGSQPSANVTVTVTDVFVNSDGITFRGDTGIVTLSPKTVTFTPIDWHKSKDVAVTATKHDPNGVHETLTLEHTATSTDTDYNSADGLAIPSVAVRVRDDDVELGNNRPEFTEGDSDPDTDDATTREFPENTAGGVAVGDPVSATDEDGDSITYSLEGTDADSFDIDSGTGQIETKAVTYDYETQSSYSVRVRATDEHLAEETITVTIDLIDTPAPDPPDAPTVSRDAENPDSALTVTWTEPANTGPAITDYDVQYREGTSGDFIDWPFTGTDKTTTITGLSPDRTHQVQVRATSAEGSSDWSASGEERTASNDADLVGLALSRGTLTFDADTTAYTVDVAADVASLTVTPTVADTRSSVAVNGATVTSGAESDPIALSVGDNEIEVVVTAEAGNTKTTTITVRRTAPIVSVADAAAAEGAGTLTFTVTVATAMSANVTFDYAASIEPGNSADLAADLTGTLTGSGVITAGQTTTTIAIGIVQDAITEPAETFTLTLTNLSANAQFAEDGDTATGTIADDDALAVTIDESSIAGDGVVNIAEKAAGFAITGTVTAGAAVSVTLGGGEEHGATVTDGNWSLNVPGDDAQVIETSVSVSVTATKATYTDGTASGSFTVDLTAPTATYQPPASLTVDVLIADIAPGSPSADIDTYTLQAGTLPAGLTFAAASGTISGTPTTADASTSEVTIRLTDNAGNTADVPLTLPAVAAAMAPGVPGNLDLVGGERHGLGDTKARLTWSTPSSEGPPILRYELERRVTLVAGGQLQHGLWIAGNPAEIASDATTADVALSTTVERINTLRLRAVNRVGKGPWATTAQLPARPRQPGGLTVTLITSTTATLSWNAPVIYGHFGTITGYRYEWRRVGATAWHSGNAGTDRTARVTGLQPAIAYEFRVRGDTARRDGRFSDPVPKTTLGANEVRVTEMTLDPTEITEGASDILVTLTFDKQPPAGTHAGLISDRVGLPPLSGVGFQRAYQALNALSQSGATFELSENACGGASFWSKNQCRRTFRITVTEDTRVIPPDQVNLTSQVTSGGSFAGNPLRRALTIVENDRGAGAPLNLVATQDPTDADAVVLTWDAGDPGLANGQPATIDHYQIRTHTGPNLEAVNWVHDTPDARRSLTLSGLLGGLTHYFQVRAYTQVEVVENQESEVASVFLKVNGALSATAGAEGGDNVTFTVTLNNRLAQAYEGSWAVVAGGTASDADLDALPSDRSVTIRAEDEDPASFTIGIAQDNRAEGEECIRVGFTKTSPADAVATLDPGTVDGCIADDDVAARAPTALMAESTATEGEVRLRWTAPDPGELNGADATINGYQVRSATTEDDLSFAAWTDTNSDAASFTAADLSPGQTYWFQVRALTGVIAATGSDPAGAESAAASFMVNNLGTDEEDITRATEGTYMVTADELGKKLKVRASFTDDDGNDERRTSAATSTVSAVGTVSVTVADSAIAGDGVVNIAEKAAGFTITGTVTGGADVSVNLGAGAAISATVAADGDWTASVPGDHAAVTGASVSFEVTATKAGYDDGSASGSFTVDLAAPTATYQPPGSLTVGETITDIVPTNPSTDIASYAVQAGALPMGLALNASGTITGTPATANTDTSDVTIRLADNAGNPTDVPLTFPAVAKGDQTLTGFSYDADSISFGDTPPSLNAPTGAQTTLEYSATPPEVCSVDSGSGALTIAGAGECEITATAPADANYNEGTATFTLTVQVAGTLALNVNPVAGDNTVNIAERTAGFAISGDTGSEGGVSVTVTIGSTTLPATLSNADTAAWSVNVPGAASYIAGTSVVLTVSASKAGFTVASDVQRTLTVDLTAPTATYQPPSSLTVGTAITDIVPGSPSADIASYALVGTLPPGLSFDAPSGTISGTPTTASANTNEVTIRLTDDASNITDVALTLPAVIANSAPSFASSATFSVPENGRQVGTVVAEDTDAQDNVTAYQITAGADMGLFSITSPGGVLTFDAAPNFEDPQGGTANNSNAYGLRVTVTSGANHRAMTAEQDITVNVMNADDPATGAPVIDDTTPLVEQTLTASAGTIADEDGLTDPTYTWQWIKVVGTQEEDIVGATSSTYLVALDNLGARLRVRATFSDDDGNTDSRISAATSPVSTAGIVFVDVDESAIAGDGVVNIAEKEEGFPIGGTVDSGSAVAVSLAGGTPESAIVTGGNWGYFVPQNHAAVTGTSVLFTVTATKATFADGVVDGSFTVDLSAPTASYQPPATLTVDTAITDIAPGSPSSDIDTYTLQTGTLPAGLTFEASGTISGTPTTANSDTSDVTIRLTDSAGNTTDVPLTLPAVAKGDQTLSGFAYSANSMVFGNAAPTVTPPTGAKTPLEYSATPADVCTVDSATGALTIGGVGTCTITVTAPADANYNQASEAFALTVQAAGTLALNVAAVAGDNTINIAEKAAGFPISGDTGSEGGVSVSVAIGSATLTATSSNANPAVWSVNVPGTASYISGTSVDLTVSAAKTGFTAASDVQRTLTVDLAAPSATYQAPGSLTVGVAITDIAPGNPSSDIDSYALTAVLPAGLTFDASGTITGVPTTASTDTSAVTIRLTDDAGNTTDIALTLPAVAKGDQTLTGFAYSTTSIVFGADAPTVTPPTGAKTPLEYSAAPAEVCAVNASSGALNIVGLGTCTITVTAPADDNYNEASDTFTLAVQAAGTLALNVAAVAGDNTINIAEKAAGFMIAGDTGSEGGVSVTVAIGSATLTATSSNANPAVWSVDVPPAASYISGTSVGLTVSATKTGFTSPNAVTRMLTVDLSAPTATYQPPASLTVDVPISPIAPGGGSSDIDSYALVGTLPAGLSFDEPSGTISGTPTTASGDTSDVKIRLADDAANTTDVPLTFAAVAKGDQTLSGFAYSATSMVFGTDAPTVTPPTGAKTSLVYSAAPSDVCSVDSGTGMLTIGGVGVCTITVTAPADANYNEASDTFTLAVQVAGALALNVNPVAGDNTINIAERAAGFTISGDTGTESGVSVSVAIGSTTTLAATSSNANPAVWSVDVPEAASYISGTTVALTVSASKTGFTAPNNVTRTLTVALSAPSAAWAVPTSLTVGQTITAIAPGNPSPDIDSYALAGVLPAGLTFDASGTISGTPGTIAGTPTTARSTASQVTIRLADNAGNTADVLLTFPAVAKGDQTLSGFAYSANSVVFGMDAPTVTPPTGAKTPLEYSAAPAEVCTVNASSGALNIVGTGTCTVTATAPADANYNEGTAAFTLAVQTAGTLALNVAAVAGDNTVNIAEKAAGFTISGDTGSEGGVSVSVAIGSTTLTATSSNATPAVWSVDVPEAASYISGTSVGLTVSATKTGFTAANNVTRALTVDLSAPSATWAVPTSLTVGQTITAIAPDSPSTDIVSYTLVGALPAGLAVDASGTVSGTPTTASGTTSDVTIRLADNAGNTADVTLAFPAVAKGDQTLSGFAYSANSMVFGTDVPTVTPPTGAKTSLVYSATPSDVCSVHSGTGALTIGGVGMCTITVTAPADDNYNEASDTFGLAVQAAGTLALNVDPVAGDNTVNIAEKAAGFTISGDTGSEGGASVTVTIGSATLTATSSNANPAVWSVDVPEAASYISGTTLALIVSASKTGFTEASDLQRTLAVDLATPAATYQPPVLLTVGTMITDIAPGSPSSDIASYALVGTLPAGLMFDAPSGAISGIPTTANANASEVTIRLADNAGNTTDVALTLPAVAKGDQTLAGFSYSANSMVLGTDAPTVTPPTGAKTPLEYSATPPAVCAVNASSGTLTIAGAGTCTITVTAPADANYNEASDTFTLTVQPASTLAVNVAPVAGDNTVNIAERAAGFAISGDTGSESGVSVTVTIGSATLTATSSSANPAVWSVSVPPAASYISGTSVGLTVSASKTGFTARNVTRTLTVDLAAPSASYQPPASLAVGVQIATVAPGSPSSDIAAYSAAGLPSGLSIHTGNGNISGTPDTANGSASDVTVTITDDAGNAADVPISFPAVTKGTQTLTGFAYSSETASLDQAPPRVTAPTGHVADSTLSYATDDESVCTVHSGTGALTLVGTGTCVITVTASATANYHQATATFTISVAETGEALSDFRATISATDPSPLTEENLDGATLTVDLEGAKWALGVRSVPHLFRLSGVPAFVAPNEPSASPTPGGVERISDTRVRIWLGYWSRDSRYDFDEDATLSLEIDEKTYDWHEDATVTVPVIATDEPTPGQVTGLTLTPRPLRIDVEWDEVEGATGYIVQWKSGTEEFDDEERQTRCRGVTSFTIPGLDADTPYTVRVIATRFKADADGEPSDEATATPLADEDAKAETSISLSPATVNEGDGSVDIEVTVDLGEVLRDRQYILAVANPSLNTAKYREDYRGEDPWPPWYSGRMPEEAVFTLTLPLTLIDDAKVEDDETLVVWFQVVSASGSVIERTLEATLTITDNDGPQSNVATAMATGPPLSAADARVKEGAGAVLEFTISLDRAALGTVTVDYATADDTATAGLDYEAAAGTLTFAPGETSARVAVAVLDDVIDEGEETLVLRLSNASGAWIADGEATGTIKNSDPLPKAWLARFARTAADHAVDAVQTRFDERASTGAHATVGGMQLWSGGAKGDGDSAEDVDGQGFGLFDGGPGDHHRWIRSGPHGGGLGMGGDPFSALGTGTVPGMSTATGGSMHVDAPHSQQQTLRNLLLASSFLYSHSSDGDDEAKHTFTAWGRASATHFNGVDSNANVNGEVATYLVGADLEGKRWLGGLAMAHSAGLGAFTANTPGLGVGVLNTWLTTVHPYLRWQASDRLSVWSLLGYGFGQLDLTMDDSELGWRTDIAMQMAAGGARGVLARAVGFEMAAKMDARIARIVSGAAEGAGGRLADTAGDTSRLRLALEGSRTFTFGGSRTFAPTLEIGMRRDGGDVDSGLGIDLGGTLRYADPALGLTVETSGRHLVAHQDAGYREWGASASITLDPGSEDRGLSLALAPSWGVQTTGGAERLWSRHDTGGLANGGYGMYEGMRLDANVGYGLDSLRGRGSMRPFLGLRLAGPARDWRTGIGWTRGPNVEFGFEAKRRETPMLAPEHGIEVKVGVRR